MTSEVNLATTAEGTSSKGFNFNDCKQVLREFVVAHRLPLLVLGCLAISLKVSAVLCFVWSALLLGLLVFSKPWQRLPPSFRHRAASVVPARLRFAPWRHELEEGVEQCKPFVLLAAYFSVIPVALYCLASTWIKKVFRVGQTAEADFIVEADRIDFIQNRQNNQEEEEENFLHSPMFAITALAFYLSGIPALLTFQILQHYGLAFIDGPPTFSNIITSKLFLLNLYLPGLAAAASVLFMRAWFTFPLNFLHDEHRVELSDHGVRRHDKKGWLLYALTMNRPSAGPDSLAWSEVKSINYATEGCTKLHPLPDTLFPKSSVIYKILNSCAAFIDGLSNKITGAEYINVSTIGTESAFGHALQINVTEMNQVERAHVFHFIQRSAPHSQISKQATKTLLGVDANTDPRYTQIWFDLLTSTSKADRQARLSGGEVLKSSHSTWLVLEPLVTGGQANTYVARRQDGQICILKEFILSQADAAGAMIQSATEFEAEATVLSQLHHENIVQLLDFFADSGRVYIALEHVEGQTLKDLVQSSGKLRPAQVRLLGLALCDVLTYLHNQTPAVVHRDVTPENIIVRPDGSIKLIDFGLSVRQAQKSRTTSVGKHCYTPPEQFRDQITPQSDIYALGATLHYMLTGTQPRPLSQSSPASLEPAIDPAFNNLVELATAQDLESRYESIEWLRIDLQKLSSNPDAKAAGGTTIRLGRTTESEADASKELEIGKPDFKVLMTPLKAMTPAHPQPKKLDETLPI